MHRDVLAHETRLLQIPVRVTFQQNELPDGELRQIHTELWRVLLGSSGTVVSLYSSCQSRGHPSKSLTIEFEDKDGQKVDFHAWCACRPRWPLEYGLINAKKWFFWSSDPTHYGHRGGGPSSQRVNETVRFHQLRLTVSSSGRMHGLDLRVYAEQSHPAPRSTTGN